MERGLHAEYPVLRQAFDAASELQLLPRPLRDVMWHTTKTYSIPPNSPTALFAVEVALFRLLVLRYRPVSVMGHSIGELSAAHVAGVSLDYARHWWSPAPVSCRFPVGRAMIAVQATEQK